MQCDNKIKTCLFPLAFLLFIYYLYNISSLFFFNDMKENCDKIIETFIIAMSYFKQNFNMKILYSFILILQILKLLIFSQNDILDNPFDFLDTKDFDSNFI